MSCKIEKQKQRISNNIEKIKDNGKQYDQQYREKIIEKKEYYQQNREKTNEKKRMYINERLKTDVHFR